MPISVAASWSCAVARMTRPVWVHFMKAKRISVRARAMANATTWERLNAVPRDRKSTRLNSSHRQISYAVFCLKTKKRLIARTLSFEDETVRHARPALAVASAVWTAPEPLVRHDDYTLVDRHPVYYARPLARAL